MNETKDVWAALKDAESDIKILQSQKLELRKREMKLQNVIIDLTQNIKSMLEAETYSELKQGVSDLINELEEDDWMKIQCDCGEIITQDLIVQLDDGDAIFCCPNCGEVRLYG